MNEVPAVSNYGYRLLLMALIIGINSFLAASETALVSARPSKLKALAADGVVGAQAALNLLSNPERLFSVVQVGLTLASLALGWVGEDTLFSMLYGSLGVLITPAAKVALTVACLVLAFMVMTYFHVVVGEVVPKNLAIDKADRLAVIVAPILLVFYRLAEPFVFVIEKSAGWASGLLGVKGGGMHAGHSAEELKYVVNASHASGHISEFELESLRNVLELDALTAREVMTPRNQLVMLEARADIDEALRVFGESRFSRLPVYEDDRENVIGIVHVKDVLDFWMNRRLSTQRRQGVTRFDLRRIMRKLPVTPETKTLSTLLCDMREEHAHVALVVDEFGAIAGLISMEDVMEQVFGEIEDEFDPQAPDEEPPESGPLELDGSTPLRDLEMQHGIILPDDLGFGTLAGFLLYRLGRIPDAGDAHEEDGRRYTVLEMDHNRIVRVRVEIPIG